MYILFLLCNHSELIRNYYANGGHIGWHYYAVSAHIGWHYYANGGHIGWHYYAVGCHIGWHYYAVSGHIGYQIQMKVVGLRTMQMPFPFSQEKYKYK